MNILVDSIVCVYKDFHLREQALSLFSCEIQVVYSLEQTLSPIASSLRTKDHNKLQEATWEAILPKIKTGHFLKLKPKNPKS